MNLRVHELLQVSHLQAKGFSKIAKTERVGKVSTDSRNVRRGDVFIALRGENFDGHNFLEDIKRKGAVAAIVDGKWFKRNPGFKLPCLVVKNTLDAFGEIGNLYRQKFSIPILVVAGSNGKTTTKDLIAHVLESSLKVLKTEANFNNQVGLPQMLLKLRPSHQIAVLEIGTNHPGEIAWLTNTAEPTHAIVTNIGREHLEFFKNLDGVASEELSCLYLTEEHGGFAFINHDDRYIRPLQKLFEEWSIAYGTMPGADVRAQSAGFDAKGKHKIKIQFGKTEFTASTQLLADYAPNLIAATTAVALHFGLTKAKIKKALETYVPHSKRMEVVRTSAGITIINDAYNANPESFASAFSTLDRMKSRGKKFVAAGDMFELGNASSREHAALGKLMAEYRFAGYFLTGSAMEHAYKTLHKQRGQTVHGSKNTITTDLKKKLKRGDILLVKGSRGMRMEEIVEALR